MELRYLFPVALIVLDEFFLAERVNFLLLVELLVDTLRVFLQVFDILQFLVLRLHLLPAPELIVYKPGIVVLLFGFLILPGRRLEFSQLEVQEGLRLAESLVPEFLAFLDLVEDEVVLLVSKPLLIILVIF